MNCVADVRGDRCEIWAPTQAPNNVQSEVAKLLGIPLSAVTVHVTLIGGGFGRRLGWDYALEAAEVSKAIGAPVQVMWTRADDMKHGYFQAASLHQLSGRFDENRKLVAWTHKKVSSLHNARGWPTERELNDPGYYRDSASWGVYDIACNVYDGETHVGYAAEVSVTRDEIRVRRVVCVIDCGLIVNPLGVESQVEGGVIWGLSSALKGAITFRDGAVEQSTYRDFTVL